MLGVRARCSARLQADRRRKTIEVTLPLPLPAFRRLRAAIDAAPDASTSSGPPPNPTQDGFDFIEEY